MKRSIVSEVWPARACVKVEFPELSYSLAQLSKDVSDCLRKKVQPWPWRTAGLGGGQVGAGVIEGIWTVRLGHLEAPSILSFFCLTVPEVFIWENKAMAPKPQCSLFTYYHPLFFLLLKWNNFIIIFENKTSSPDGQRWGHSLRSDDTML